MIHAVQYPGVIPYPRVLYYYAPYNNSLLVLLADSEHARGTRHYLSK